ncbi:MAG: hypothetical protein COB35_09780 [Gammaproteobacteria bacterium]|nr:MAG: hypothetical protein COB35_09780 [Gammaproteobacteria bacterium]
MRTAQLYPNLNKGSPIASNKNAPSLVYFYGLNLINWVNCESNMKEIKKALLDMTDIIARISLFDTLSSGEKKILAQNNTLIVTFNANENLLTVGASDTSFFVILSGKVNIIKNDIIINVVDPGSFVGEVGFICGEPRTATVTAITPVIAMHVNQQNFASLPMTVREKIKDGIISGLVNRVNCQNERLLQFMTQNNSSVKNIKIL